MPSFRASGFLVAWKKRKTCLGVSVLGKSAQADFNHDRVAKKPGL